MSPERLCRVRESESFSTGVRELSGGRVMEVWQAFAKTLALTKSEVAAIRRLYYLTCTLGSSLWLLCCAYPVEARIEAWRLLERLWGNPGQMTAAPPGAVMKWVRSGHVLDIWEPA